jgi:hypothetical protein
VNTAKKSIKKTVAPKAKKKPWPKCSTCPKPAVMSRVKYDEKGKESREHFCQDHWVFRAPRNLKPTEKLNVALKPKVEKAKKKVVKKVRK